MGFGFPGGRGGFVPGGPAGAGFGRMPPGRYPYPYPPGMHSIY